METESVHHIGGKLTDNTGLTTDITDALCGDIRTDSQCVDDCQFGIGGMYVGTLECSLDLPYSMKDELKGGTITIDFGAETSAGVEWIPLGVWNIAECTRESTDRIRLTGVDNMNLLRKETEARLKNYVGIVHVESLMKHVTALTGIEFAQTIDQLQELTAFNLSYYIRAVEYGATAWSEVKAIAQILGCFAFANRQGKIEFRRLDNTAPVLKITADRRHSAALEEYTYTVRGLKYTDSKGYSVQKDIETADAYGGVPGFSECSLILEPEESDKDRQYRNYLSGILPNLENVRFTPGTVGFYGNPAIDIGDYVTVSEGAAQHSGDVPFLVCCSSWQFRGVHTLTAYGFSESASESSSSSSKESEQVRTVNITKSIVTVELFDYPGELFDVERTVAEGGFSCRSQTNCFIECSMVLLGGETDNVRLTIYMDDTVQTFQPVFTLHEGEYASPHFTIPLSCTADTHSVKLTAAGKCSIEQLSAAVWGQNITEICPEPTGDEDYIYTVSGGAVTVVEYIGKSLLPEIPEKLGGAQVKTIGSASFTYSEVENVYIPEGVTEIE